MMRLFFACFLFWCVEGEAVKAIVTDIEGTTTSISFVHDVLFPYAKEHVADYLSKHQHETVVAGLIQDVKQAAETTTTNLDDVIAILTDWMNQDKKITPLKALQGLMWEEGYHQGAFTGHIYPDAYQKLKEWKEGGVSLYVYSSGSVQAQKLLFGYSLYGDMTELFSGYFDTKIGGKKESSSYQKIAEAIALPTEEILFLSDSIDEVDAALKAGMKTILVCREGTHPPQGSSHLSVVDFETILLP